MPPDFKVLPFVDIFCFARGVSPKWKRRWAARVNEIEEMSGVKPPRTDQILSISLQSLENL